MTVTSLHCIVGHHSLCTTSGCECSCHEPPIPAGKTRLARRAWWGFLIAAVAYVIAFVWMSLWM